MTNAPPAGAQEMRDGEAVEEPSPAYRYEIVVVSYRSRDQVSEMLGCLPAGLPVVLVDNSSGEDGVADVAGGRPATRYVDAGGNTGFARAANLGARTSIHDYVVFGNPDSRPAPDVYEALIDELEADPSIGCCAPATTDASGEVEVAVGGWEPTVARALVQALRLHRLLPRAGLWARPAVGEPITLDWINGACLAVRRDTFLTLGGFDERYLVYNEDMAFGRRLREAGLRPVLRTDLVVPHLGGSSGAGSSRMAQLRGRSMTDYLYHHNSLATATLIRALIGSGDLLRLLWYVVRRDGESAQAYRDYLRGLLLPRTVR